MSSLTLQEILLGLTFILTVLNIYGNWQAQRQRRMATEPIIQTIRQEMAVLRNEMVPKGELLERLASLETAFRMCRDGCMRDRLEHRKPV